MSGLCGAQLCSVFLYVREDALLKLAMERLSGGFEILGGKPPAIRLFAHGGDPYAVKWNGKEFR